MKVILASSSPRRISLLKELGWDLVIRQSGFREASSPDETEQERPSWAPLLKHLKGPDRQCAWNALGKAESAAGEEDLPVIGADTIVVLDGKTMGKPKNRADAKRMLRLLSGRSHEVKTGIAVLWKGRAAVHVETTKVFFKTLTEKEIEDYTATGECDDKAGAYAIQGLASLWIPRIEGSYDNVVGLPRAALWELMQRMEEKK